MVNIADIHLSPSHARALDLRMTFEAEIEIALDEQLGVNAAVRAVADRTALPQRRMLKDEGPGLFPVALSTGFAQPRHGQPAGRFVDVAAVRIMALHAVHLFLRHRVVLGELELRLFLAMALETSRRVLAGIENELASPAAAGDMQAGRPMARFTARLPNGTSVFEVDSEVGAGRKDASDALVAVGASFVADERRAWNGGCRKPRSRGGGTRIYQQSTTAGHTEGNHPRDDPLPIHS